ncbi:ABC transporter permease subunit [Streptomyces sp. Da 82-17]|uniref:ABC transporter permease subunit n=1 Tax=Streptomyces sp. Da 82-17 TaxID=3377116 RepID=UPI0038D3F331
MASLTYDLTLAGLSVGSAAALTGIGLIVTYRATGVLNLAHGAVAMVCAYLLRQLAVEWGWPLWLAALVTLCVAAPGIGLVLERGVFRPLAVLGGDPAQTLVASIGVFVLLVGGAALVWGQGARADAPELLSGGAPWVQLGAALVLALAVAAVGRWTRFGGELRAVVDNRSLAVVSGIDADRVAAAGWAFGSFTAGLTGVLLAPYVRLDPYGLPLLVMEVVAVAVAAGMRSLPIAVLVALGLGVAQAQLTRLHPGGRGEPLLQAVGANLFVVALLVAALVLPDPGRGRGRPALPRTATARVRTPPGAWLVAGVLFLLPLGFAGSDLHTAVQVPALAVVLLSLVVVTGRGGQISLGQSAYAGLGALFTALLAAGRFPGLPALPTLAALGLAVLLVAPLGLLTGGPAIRRHGLALALATLAVGVGVSRFVFDQPYATSGLGLDRPAGLDGDRAYYLLELALLCAASTAVAALRRGRTGRALAAMRDHEAGAAAAGVPVARLKVGAFVAGAALAALGGGMLALGVRAFDPAAFDPVRGLLWFAAVVVLGADSLLGALLAAALLVGLDEGARGGVAAAAVGVLAVLLGRFPGGPYEALRAAAGRLRRRGEPGVLTPLGVRVAQHLRASGRRTARPGSASVPTTAPARPRTTAPGPAVAPTTAPPGPPTAAAGSTAARGHPGGSASALLGRFPYAARRAASRLRHRPAPPTAPRTPTTVPPQRHRRSSASALLARVPSKLYGALRAAARLRGRYAASPVPRVPTAGPPPRPDRTTARRGPAPAGSTAPRERPRGASALRRLFPYRALRAAVARWHLRRATVGPGPPAAAPRPRTRAPAHPGRTPGSPFEPPSPPAPPAADSPARPPRPPSRPRPAAPRSPAEPSPPPGPLTGRGLSVRYGEFTALDGVDVDVPAGRITGVVGPNGAGKSTLFHCLAGTVGPHAVMTGRVRFAGLDLTDRPAHARARLGIARTFQQLAVFPSLTVAENVAVGAEQGRVRDARTVGRALSLLGLDGPVRDRPAARLPTGTLRRVELARALAGAPHVLLLDEPAAGLDTAEVAALTDLLRTLAAEGTALLIVEHDLDLVAHLADTVHVLASGRITATGPPADVLARLAVPREGPAEP